VRWAAAVAEDSPNRSAASTISAVTVPMMAMQYDLEPVIQ
jgi:hypothetical protein